MLIKASRQDLSYQHNEAFNVPAWTGADSDCAVAGFAHGLDILAQAFDGVAGRKQD
jgi:hypothetical protein